MISDDVRILVLCTGNSCRSQMAEWFFRHYLTQAGLTSAAASVRSAGLEPHGLNPLTVKVMAEAGGDISDYRSEPVERYADEHFDFVITVCDHAVRHCPTFPGGGEHLHWSFDDPAQATGSDQEILAEFRRVRDQIRQQVKNWLDWQTRILI